jgi:MFS family permease
MTSPNHPLGGETGPGGNGLWSTIRQAATFEVLVACAIAFINISVVSAAGPVLGQIQEDFLIPTALMGLIGSTFGLARLLVDLPAGNLAGRMDARWLTGAGLMVMGVGSSLAVLAGSYAALLVARVLMGAGQSVASIANLTWIVNAAAPALRNTVMAMYQTGIVTALSFYPFLSGLLAEKQGWRAAFVLCAISAVIGIGLVLLGVRRGRPFRQVGGLDHSAGNGLRALAKLPRIQRLGLLGVYGSIFLLMFNSVGFVGTAVPLFGHEVLALRPSAIGTGLAVASMIGLAVTIPGGAWADRFGPMRVLLPGFAAIVVGSLGFLLVRDAVGFVLAAAVVGLYSAGSSVPSAVLGAVVPSHLRGPAVGLYRLAGDIGVLIGPVLLTWAIDVAGYRSAILVSAAVAAVVTLSAWRLIGPCAVASRC